MQEERFHTPVLVGETISLLVTSPEGVYIDCTLGGGGHAEAILHRLNTGKLFGFDRDADAIRTAGHRLRAFGDLFEPIHAPFSQVKKRLAASHVGNIHGILFDLGVSSHHLDTPERGFTFQNEGPLDMRMDLQDRSSAADVVNTYDENDLASVLSRYGEERYAGRIVRAIVRQRPVTTTRELADIIRTAVGPQHVTKSLARVFQAIRIEVNQELKELHSALQSVPELLREGGRVVVLTYHSLEDRIVKEFFRIRSQERDTSVSRFLPERRLTPELKVLTRRPVRPTSEEIERNPRARSAKLRAAERLNHHAKT